MKILVGTYGIKLRKGIVKATEEKLCGNCRHLRPMPSGSFIRIQIDTGFGGFTWIKMGICTLIGDGNRLSNQAGCNRWEKTSEIS